MANINLTGVAHAVSTASATPTREARAVGDARGFVVYVDKSGNVTASKNGQPVTFPLSLADAKGFALTTLKAVS